MLYQSATKSLDGRTPDRDVTLTASEIVSALIPASIGVAVVALIAVLMLV